MLTPYLQARALIAEYLQSLRLFNRDVRLFLVTAFLIGFSWDGVRAVLLNLYLLRLDYGPEFIGLVTAAGSLAFALFSLPAGALGMRWSSRSLILAGVGLMVAGLGLTPLAEYLPATIQKGWFLATSVLSFMGLATYFVNSLPFLMGATGPQERNYAFAAQIALTPLAGFAGSLVAGVLPALLAKALGLSLQDPAVYRYPLWLSALLLIPGALVLFFARGDRRQRAQEPLQSQGPLQARGAGMVQAPAAGMVQAPAAGTAQAPAAAGGRAPWDLILVIALVVSLRFASRGSVGTFFNVYMDDALGASTALIGVLAAATQLASVPAALAAPLLAARWGNGRTVIWGTAAMSLFMLPLALIPTWAAAGLGSLGSYAMLSLSTGPIRVYSQEIVAPRWRATMSGALMMGSGLAFSAISLSGGFAIVALGYSSVFLAAAGLTAAGVLIFWAYFRVPRGELACPSTSEVSG